MRVVVVPLERIAEACTSVEDLTEDWLTSWVVDVGAHVDVSSYAESDASRWTPSVQWLRVPRPTGLDMSVPVLDPKSHFILHAAVAPLRHDADALLADGVFGYRRGADFATRYATEWQRFSARAAELSADAHHVVVADVERFFSATGWNRVLESLEGLDDRLAPLRHVAATFSAAGLKHLPAGYSDARMLANLVLREVDRQLPVPFVRWVDDYTLFVPRTKSPDETVQAPIARCDPRVYV